MGSRSGTSDSPILDFFVPDGSPCKLIDDQLEQSQEHKNEFWLRIKN